MFKNIGFAITGSFCTHEKILPEIQNLVDKGYKVIPIFSLSVSNTDTRFGTAKDFEDKITKITGISPIKTMTDAEPVGPKNMIDVLVVAPCTGNTLSKLANAISDTPVTMVAKSLMRNNKPIVLGISTNDALGFNLENIAKLLSAKNVFFVPLVKATQQTNQNRSFAIGQKLRILWLTLTNQSKFNLCFYRRLYEKNAFR